MRYLKKFELFELQQNYQYIDGLIGINEGFLDAEKINRIWSKILSRTTGLSDKMKRKIIIYGIASLLTLGSVAKITQVIQKYKAQTEDIVIKDAIDEALSQFKDASTLEVSSKGQEHIKKHEDLKLKAYRLKDGKITVGWGHAEPARKSKYKSGQIITEVEAEQLFKKDLNLAQEGVKRIFDEWNQKGIDVKITQDQFDAMVSMALNMGVSGLRQSDFIQEVKKGNLEAAGELIKTTNIDDVKFPGLRNRRANEAKMFLSFLDQKQS